MAATEQLLLAVLWTLLSTTLRSRSEQVSNQSPPPPPPSAASSNTSEQAPVPHVQAARETHMAAAGAAAADASASHPLLTLVLVLTLGSVSVAAAFGLRRVFGRLFFRDRLGGYRYFKVNQDDDGELMAVDGEYHVALDDSSEDELGPARLPVNTPEAAQVRRSCLSPPPEAKSLLIDSSDEELLQ